MTLCRGLCRKGEDTEGNVRNAYRRLSRVSEMQVHIEFLGLEKQKQRLLEREGGGWVIKLNFFDPCPSLLWLNVPPLFSKYPHHHMSLINQMTKTDQNVIIS